MSNILITGANGYIGARLSKHLAMQGHTLFGLCYPDIPDNKEWIAGFKKIIKGNIREQSTLEKLAELHVDSIIHLISLDHIQSEQDPTLVMSVNVTPVWLLLDAFKNKNLTNFLYFSTIHVYGKTLSGIITEERTPEPANAYGLTHYLTENIIDYYNRITNINCISVRLSNSYGYPVLSDDKCWDLVINDLCRSAFLKRKIQLLSDGFPLRDFIHGEDVCNAVELILDKSIKGKTDRIYHVCSQNTLTIRELAFLVAKVYRSRYGREIPVLVSGGDIITDNQGQGDQKKYIISNNRLSQIGFRQKVTIEEGIADLFNYLDNINA